jgi:hypothetical protein
MNLDVNFMLMFKFNFIWNYFDIFKGKLDNTKKKTKVFELLL